MSKIIVIDTREEFLSEVAACCRSLQADFLPIADPIALKERPLVLHDAVVAVWADYPPCAGVNVPRTILRAITASRLAIPVILYTARKETLTGLLEPGVQFPTLIVTAHACSVAGAIRRILRQQQTNKNQINAFEDWASQNQVSIAGSPGKVSVFKRDNEGGFNALTEPRDPLTAVGCLLQASQMTTTQEPVFY